MITSTANKQVKYVNNLIKKSKARREEDLFVAEGLRMCQEIPKDRIKAIYVAESFYKNPKCAELLEGVAQVELVTDEVFRALSDTQSPQGILALVKQYHYDLAQVIKTEADNMKIEADAQLAESDTPAKIGSMAQVIKPAHLMILEHLQDPGNLGTILRAGEGAGVTGIVMDAGTADIYNPKVIRSTMGSILRVPFVYVEDLQDTLKEMKAKGITLFAAHLKGENSYDKEDYRKDVGFLIGNEANGLSDAVAQLADTYIRIPMEGQVESLNAAVAASVLMFEVARQRRG